MSVKDSQTNRINMCKDAAEEERSSFMYYPSRIGGSRQLRSLHEAHEALFPRFSGNIVAQTRR